MKIIGTGITGLVGSRIVELLTPKGFEFVNLSLETGVDISRPETMEDKFENNSDAEWVIHLAAKADVDGCERDQEEDMKILGYEEMKRIKEMDTEEIIRRAIDFYGRKTAWALNVIGTLNIVNLCLKHHKRLIYISTDFVFDGNKDEAYIEEDLPNPINFYAQTKYLGEKIVQNLMKDYLICRIAYPYRANFLLKKDFVRGLIDRFKQNQQITAVTDQYITPTFIDDLVYGLEALISSNQKGIYHLVGSSSLTPYEAASLIAKVFEFDTSLIKKTSREVFYAGRALRPFNLKLSNDKIKNLGIKIKRFEEGLIEIKRQIEK
jgi:dTDP-4-dehydrorhamnose reductase